MIRLNKFFIPYVLLLLFIGLKAGLLTSFLVVIMHEFVHYITARFMGYSGFDIEIHPLGAVLKLKDLEEALPKEDLIIAVSGPLFNIILAVIFYCLNIRNEFYYANLVIGLFNLVPILPLDGGRILRDIIANRTIYKRADSITAGFSLVIGFLMIIINLALYFRGNFNYSFSLITLFTVFCAFKEKERIVYIIMGDIVRKKSKFLKRGFLENKTTSVFFKKELLYTLSLVDKGRFNIFTVLNEDMEVIDVIYESEIIEALKQYGNMTLEDFVYLREENN